jgi:hypothetical protein
MLKTIERPPSALDVISQHAMDSSAGGSGSRMSLGIGAWIIILAVLFVIFAAIAAYLS